MNGEYSGQCLCGGVSFALRPPYDAIWCCHCTMCQRNYAVYGAFFGVLREHITIEGEENLAWDYHSAEYLHLLAGTINDSLAGFPRVHMCAAEKSGAYTIAPEDRQFAEFPGADTVAGVIKLHG